MRAKRNEYKTLVGEFEGKIPLGGWKHRRDDYIKLDTQNCAIR
jgi:hypothetical protein